MVMMRPIKEIFQSYAVLDDQGRHLNGTDKQSNHNYSDAYERLFTCSYPEHPSITPWSIRNSVQRVMEIGVADGSSLLAWAEVFPNAEIVGMDIHHAVRASENKRITFHQGDQRSYDDCLRAAGWCHFDAIIEDATHQLEDSLRTFLYLWPSVKRGGLYIIEEFANVGALADNIRAMWPYAEIIPTEGPFGGNEPLVVFRKLK